MESEKNDRTTTDKVGETEIAERLLRDGFCNRTMSRINAIMQQEVFALIKSAELAFRECLESMINARREDGKPALDPSVADKIAAHYEHAKAKHPYFCDKLLQSEQNKVRSIQVRATTLKDMRALCTVQEMFQALSAETVLNCELAEVYEVYARGDTAHAVEECYDAIAVLLRMIDVLEGRQALGNPNAPIDGAKKGRSHEMTNLEKYPNVTDAVRAWNRYKDIENPDIGILAWLYLDYIEPRLPSLLEAAKAAKNWMARSDNNGDGVIICSRLNAAIAAEEARPKRNYERFATADEAYDALMKMCDTMWCKSCRFSNGDNLKASRNYNCAIHWLYSDRLDLAKDDGVKRAEKKTEEASDGE